MTTLTELVTDVYAITNRPDLVSETELAVRNATLKMHRSDFYSKDLFETGIEFSSPAYVQTLAIKNLLPSYRALKYLRKYDSVGLTPGDFLEIVTPEDILDSYKQTRENTVYGAGLNLQIRSNTQEMIYLLGCYLFPNVTAAGYSSWIADEQPSAIQYEAALTIFKMIGYDEQAAVYQRQVLDEVTTLQFNNVLINGY